MIRRNLIVTVAMATAIATAIPLSMTARADEANNSGTGSNSSTSLDDTKLEYPELEVTPRASERLEMEAKYEYNNTWQTHLPVQFSALMTLIAATGSNPNSNLSSNQMGAFNTAKRIGIGVGIGWLALTAGLSQWYRPYFDGYKEIKHMPAKTKREQLARERIAEEAIYEPEDLGFKLEMFSFVSNLASNVALMSANSNRNSQTMLWVAAASSFAPLLFPYRWERVAEEHRLYKKKIYGPIASAIVMPVQESRYSAPNYSPGVGLQWIF